MSSCRQALLLAATLAATWGTVHQGQAQNVFVLNPDLAFHANCKNKPRPEVESSIEEFLKSQNFSVLNVGRIQKEHGVFFLNTEIIGLDKDRRIIKVVGIPRMDTKYPVIVETPPPTHRSSELEQAMLTFASTTLGCEVSQVSRGENGVDAIQYYNSEVSRIEGLFRQAEFLQK